MMELEETVDKTAPCGAITEKRPNRLGGCVGVFFQLFDWNRRLAKKKIFSRKSLLPGKQTSKRFGGNEKMLKSKLNLIDDENKGSEVVEFRSPSLVARLMGLESIPSNHKDKANKKKKKMKKHSNDQCCVFNVVEEEEEESVFDKSRPQKMQRTIGACDRGVAVKKFGSEALRIKNVLTRVRKQHHNNSFNHHHQKKLASPVRSPRLHRRNSRLIDAATRILEPGKKSSTKCAIAYPDSSGSRNTWKEPVEVVVSPEFQCGYSKNTSVASCKACGSFVDVHGSSLVAEETGKNTSCVSQSTPFERSKRNVFWKNQEPSLSVSRNSIDRTERHGKDEMAPPCIRNRYGFSNHVLQRERFHSEARSYALYSKRSCNSSPANAINSKEKDFIAMNRGSSSKNLHTKSLAKVDDSSSSPARKRRVACLSGNERGSSFMGPVLRRVDGESSCACSNDPSGRNEAAFAWLKLGSPHRKGAQRVPNQTRTLGLIQQKLKELASHEQDEAIRGSVVPKKPASLILHEFLSSLAMEQPCTRDIDMPYAETVFRRKRKTEMWSDYTSPGSVLDASFSTESCFSNNFDNISVSGHTRLPLETDWDILEDSAKKSTSGGKYQAIANLVRHVTDVLHCLSNTGLISTQQRFTNAREVIIHTELLACTTTTQDNYFIGPELFDELMIYAARSDSLVNLPGITGGFLVDAMIEHLEERNTSCRLKPSNAEVSVLIRFVLEEVPKWVELAWFGMDEVIGIEMKKPMDVETHLLDVGTEIAYEILWCLVGELTIELF